MKMDKIIFKSKSEWFIENFDDFNAKNWIIEAKKSSEFSFYMFLKKQNVIFLEWI